MSDIQSGSFFSDPETQTVEQFVSVRCSIGLFYELTAEERGDYWKTAWKFYNDNKSKIVASLTQKQKAWLYKIIDGLLRNAGQKGV